MSFKGEIERHGFAVELCSKDQLKRFHIHNEPSNSILIEGFLGELREVTLVEGLMLEVKGSNGVIRIEMTEEQLKKTIPR